MKNIRFLFKRDITEFKHTFKENRDVTGAISSAVIMLIIYSTFIFVFYKFAYAYLTTRKDATGGVFELMTFVYAASALVGVILGVRKIYGLIVAGKDYEVLLCQPVGASELFMYKLVRIYASQILSTAVIVIPSVISIDLVTNFDFSVTYYLKAIFGVLTLPFVTCAVAALISVPYAELSRFLESRFVVKLIIYVAVIGIAFYFYGMFLQVLKELLSSGDILYLLTGPTVKKLTAVAEALFPINRFAMILVGRQTWLSILIILAFALGCLTVAYFIIRRTFIAILQRKMEGESVKLRKFKEKKRSLLATLMHKEFITVIRTPSYAFQYFATTLTLPFIVYVCVNILRSLIQSLTIIKCDYELALFVISMFAVMTNTFCATNIGRDGNMFDMTKTLPVTPKEVISSKILFCMIVSAISVFLSVLALALAHFVNLWQAAVILVLTLALSFAEIAFATNKDLVSHTRGGSDKGISSFLLIGLIVSLVCGVGTLALSVALTIFYDGVWATVASVIFVAVIVGGVTFVATWQLKKDLNAKFYSLI